MMTPSLKDMPFVKDATPEALADAEAAVHRFSLPAGWALFKEGEEPDGIYFLVSGSLGAFRTGADNRPELLGHIRALEPVGEMALIAGENHSASVYALRDSEILWLERAAFDRLVRRHPTLMHNLARTMLFRTRQNRRRGEARALPKVVTLVATSPTIDITLRAREIMRQVERLGKRCAVATDIDYDSSGNFCDELERSNDVVLLATRIEDSAWCRFCLRQADRIWVFARSDARPSRPLLPEEASPARALQLVDVVLIRHGGERQAAEPSEWLAAAGGARLFHWRELDQDDCARLSRVLTGQSVGLVLAGGGARAYAHIGAVVALREAGVPIDFLGGASMGGVVAACVAMGWSDGEIERRIRKGFVETNPLGDYRLPVVAFVRGKRVDERLAEHFGDAGIEDLRLPFYCVSSNLTNGAYRVHRRGILRHALRASIALPGILPPVVEEEQVLVDGAVLNNFPVDVMQEMHRGVTIGVDVARSQPFDSKDFINPPGFWGWVSRFGFRAAPPIVSLLMRTATIGINPWANRSETDMLILPELGDIDLRDWKSYDQVVAAGYQATAQGLRDANSSLARRLRLVTSGAVERHATVVRGAPGAPGLSPREATPSAGAPAGAPGGAGSPPPFAAGLATLA
jgi:NTE family protein